MAVRDVPIWNVLVSGRVSILLGKSEVNDVHLRKVEIKLRSEEARSSEDKSQTLGSALRDHRCTRLEVSLIQLSVSTFQYLYLEFSGE